MLIHYFKIAFRNMWHQKGFAIVNIGGFAIGIAACLLIALYIQNETSYDRQNANSDRVYRVVGESRRDGITSKDVSFPAPMAQALQHDFPEIEKAGRLMPNALFGATTNQVRRPDQQGDTYEEGFSFADPSMLAILDIKMLYGDREHALDEPNSVVICKSMADKYFPAQDPVGKTLIFNDNPGQAINGGWRDAGFSGYLSSSIQKLYFIVRYFVLE